MRRIQQPILDVDDVLVLDARYHFDRSTAATADLNIDVEYALELYPRARV